MENDTKKMIGALLVGTAVGAAIGILFAPAKGADTRKAIGKKSEDFTDILKEKFSEFVEGLRGEYEKVKDKASDFAENGHAKKEPMRSVTDSEHKSK